MEGLPSLPKKECNAQHGGGDDVELSHDFHASTVNLHSHERRRGVKKQHLPVPPSYLPMWLWEALSEFLGTLWLVLIGTGVVATSVTSGAQQGVWQVAVVWGWAVTLAIFIVGPISGAHLNPAVTVCLVVFRSKDFPWRVVLHYIPAQFFGAFMGSLIVYGVWESSISAFELRNNITRGAPGSEASAMCFGEYFPNPSFTNFLPSISPGLALGVEVIGTFMVMLTILAITDKRNASYRTSIMSGMAPFWIGGSVAMAISVFAPLTMAGLNPARDFSPRMVALIFGWGFIAIPANTWWVYFFGPFIGAVLSGALYRFTLGRHYKERCAKGDCDCT